MTVMRGTWYFAQDKYAWTESHLIFAPGTGAPLAAGVPLAIQYADLRVQTLGNNSQLFKIRLSAFPASRLVLDQYPGQFPGTPTWPPDILGGLVYSAARPFECILVNLSDGVGGQRNFFFAGIPTGMIRSMSGDRTGLQWGSAGDFSARFQALMVLLINGNYGWITRSKLTRVQVQGLVTNAAYPNQIGIVTGAAIGVAIGQQVVMAGWRRINVKSPRLGGVWTVQNILPPVAPATQYTYFLLNSGQVSTTNFKGLGTIAVLTPQTSAYAFFTEPSATRRARGATAGAPRGRVRSRF